MTISSITTSSVRFYAWDLYGSPVTGWQGVARSFYFICTGP
jgi:hypothetical protein